MPDSASVLSVLIEGQPVELTLCQMRAHERPVSNSSNSSWTSEVRRCWRDLSACLRVAVESENSSNSVSKAWLAVDCGEAYFILWMEQPIVAHVLKHFHDLPRYLMAHSNTSSIEIMVCSCRVWRVERKLCHGATRSSVILPIASSFQLRGRRVAAVMWAP